MVPFAYTISESEKILRVVGEGSFGFAEALAATADITSDPSFSPELNVIGDFRATFLDGDIEGQEIFARSFPELAKPFHGRIALVVDGGLQRSIHELTQQLLSDRGVRIQLFQDMAEAERWVAEAP